jgi:hypothetical protein
MTQTSPYRSALGTRFDTLAPALKRHCDLAAGQRIQIDGTMSAWNRYPWLRAVIPFMPLPAKDIRVIVDHLGRIDNGELCYESTRAFHNPGGVQYSYTLTRPAPARNGQACVLDTFNDPPNIAVTLALTVLEGGRVLQQVNHGPQFALFGARRLALPGLMHVHSIAIERALDEDTIQTEVVIRHPLLGRMFGYSGVLKLIPNTA